MKRWVTVGLLFVLVCAASVIRSPTVSAWTPTCNAIIVFQDHSIPGRSGSSNPSTCLLQRGDEGDAVSQLQGTMVLCNGETAVDLVQDGIFGPQTRAALIRVQRRVGAVPDGVYGPETRDKMLQWYVYGDCTHVDGPGGA